MQVRQLIVKLAALGFVLANQSVATAQKKGGDLNELIRTVRNSDASAKSREDAVGKIGRMGDKATAAVPALAELTRSNDRTLRRAALDSLGKIGGKESADVLVPMLKNSKDPMILDIVRAVGKVGAPAEKNAVPVLIDYCLAAAKSGLQYSDEQLYREVVFATVKVAQTPDVRSLALMTILKAPPLSKRPFVKPGQLIYEPDGRREVALALVKMGGKEASAAAPVLADLLKTTLREYNNGGPRFGQPLDMKGPMSPYYLQPNAVQMIDALGQVGASARPVLPLLRALLQHPESSIQKAAEKAIQKIK